MKEASGEANMTVITLMLDVGTIIVNNLMNSNQKSSACSAAGRIWNSGKCYAASSCKTSGGKTSCTGTTLTCSENAL